MDPGDLLNIQTGGEQQAGEYTLAEIEVDMESQLTPNDLEPGAKVLLSIEGDGDGERIMSHEELSKWFVVEPSSPAPMSTDVVVQRTLEDPALKQILLETDGKPDFDPKAEQMKIRSFLAGVTNSKMTTEQSVFQGYRPNTTGFSSKLKCSECHGTFDAASFQSHACSGKVERKPKPKPKPVADSLVEKQIEKPPAVATAEPVPPASPASPAPPNKPNSLRVIQENQIRLRRYMNDELKYDVTTGMDGTRGRKSSKGPNECTQCDRKFVHASGLVRHMEKHALDLIPSQANPQPASPLAAGLVVVVKCNVCGRIFYDPLVALEHGRVHYLEEDQQQQQQQPSKAPVADKAETKIGIDEDFETFMLEGGVKMREACVATGRLELSGCRLEDDLFSSFIMGSVLQCEFCEYLFSDISDLLAHSATHLAKRRFECTACDITMSTAKEARLHFETDCVFARESMKSQSVSVSRFFACNVCELKFPNSELLQEHRYAYNHYFPRLSGKGSRLLLPCEFCDVFFDSAREVQPHNEEKHLSKKKREKETRSAASGRQRQYLCDICGKSYTQSSHLWQHLRFHQGVKPFVCPEEKCDRKFTIRPDLNDHIRKCHTGERPFHCLVCGKRFLTGSVFYQHRLIHRGERRYECEECGKRFYRADALKNHQRIHTGEKPFSCLFCTKTFRQRGDRDKHMRARHSHLDANSRLMMQMQKFQLESAAAAKAKGTKPSTGTGVAANSSPPQEVASEPEEAGAQDEELPYPIKTEQDEDMQYVALNELTPNYFVEYMRSESAEEGDITMDGQGYTMEGEGCCLEEGGCTMEEEEQQIILYETQPGRDMMNLDEEPGQDLITFNYQDSDQHPTQDGEYVSMVQGGGENAKVVVMQNNPTQPMFSNSYM